MRQVVSSDSHFFLVTVVISTFAWLALLALLGSFYMPALAARDSTNVTIVAESTDVGVQWNACQALGSTSC